MEHVTVAEHVAVAVACAAMPLVAQRVALSIGLGFADCCLCIGAYFPLHVSILITHPLDNLHGSEHVRLSISVCDGQRQRDDVSLHRTILVGDAVRLCINLAIVIASAVAQPVADAHAFILLSARHGRLHRQPHLARW